MNNIQWTGQYGVATCTIGLVCTIDIVYENRAFTVHINFGKTLTLKTRFDDFTKAQETALSVAKREIEKALTLFNS